MKNFELYFQFCWILHLFHWGLFLLLRIGCLNLLQLNCSLPAGWEDWEKVKEWKEKAERIVWTNGKSVKKWRKKGEKMEKGWKMEMPWQEKCDLNLTRCLCLCWLPCLLGNICCCFIVRKRFWIFTHFGATIKSPRLHLLWFSLYQQALLVVNNNRQLPRSIPHICHRHHRRCLCKKFLPGVICSRLNVKNWHFTV